MYCRVHIVHYAIIATFNPTGDFKGFLLSNPQLSNGGLFLEYYNKDTMLNNAKARTEVVLPDKKPLPSIIPHAIAKGLRLKEAEDTAIEQKGANAFGSKTVLTDEEFMEELDKKTLRSWSHQSYIRVVWYFMAEYEKTKQSGARRAKFVDKVFDKLKGYMGKGFHATIAYFWIQMVHNEIVSQVPQAQTFEVFWDVSSSKLGDSLLFNKYYSPALIDSAESSQDTLLPDLQPLPSLILPTKKK
jgi:hypothetical protein